MTRIQRGRGGWESRTAGALRLAALAMMCVALGVTGCSSKKKGIEGEGTGANVGNQGLGEGSLDALKNGSLGGSGTGGPLHDIHFGYNDYTVQPQDSSVLKDNASWLSQHPQNNVQIEGHCDERGSEEYNIALGAKRAQSAKDYLITLGVSPSRVSTISYGKELPLCQDHDESCWSQNRRDHFVVSGAAGATP
jgi:peptidoglycan-associated lipoprotein